MVDRIDGGAQGPSGVDGLNARTENGGLSQLTTVREGESRLAQVAERLNIPEASLQAANPGIGLAGEVTAGQELRLPRLTAPDVGPGASEPPAIKHEHIGDKRWQGNVWEAKLSARLPRTDSESLKTGAGFEDPLTAFPKGPAGFEDPLTARPKTGFEDPLTAFPKAPAGFEDPLTAHPKLGFEDPLTARPKTGFEDPLTAFPKAPAGFEDPLTAHPKLGFEDPLTAFPKAPAGFEDPLTARPKT
ncbi:MAG TPA: hypothetical protein PKN61_06215, partial [Acidobacteriota bacterium]|nr:hypothetical protein [Acidobacteriota bacterium]